MTTEQTQSDNLNPMVKQASQLATFFLIMAIGLIIVGGIHLFSILDSGFTSIALADTVYHFTLGVIVFFCSRLLKKRNSLVIYLMGAVGIVAVLYGFLIGKGFQFRHGNNRGFFCLAIIKTDQVRGDESTGQEHRRIELGLDILSWNWLATGGVGR